MKLHLTLTPLCLALVCSSAHAMGTPETFGPDARSMALAHADAADDRGASLGHNNPAAAAHVDEFRFALTEVLSVPQLALEGLPAGVGALPQPVAGLAFGVVLPLSIIVPRRLTFSVFGFFPHGALVRARARDPSTPFFYFYDTATEHYDLSLALSLRVFDFLAIGVGARTAANQEGGIDLGIDLFQGRFTRQSADTFQEGSFAPTAGISIGSIGLERVLTGRLAFVWREPTAFNVVIPAGLALDGADADAALALQMQTNYAPRSATLGLSVDVFDRVRANIDAAYLFFSQAPTPYMTGSVDLRGQTLADLGLNNTLDVPQRGQNRIPAPGFADVLLIKAGAEAHFFAERLWLRAGYQLRPSPVPDQNGSTNIVDARTHVLGAGMGLWFFVPGLVDGPLRADLSYQAQVLERRGIQKRLNSDSVGNYTASGAVHAVATSIAYAW